MVIKLIYIYYTYQGKDYKGYAISSEFNSEDKRFYIQFIKKFPSLFYMVRDEVSGYVEGATNAVREADERLEKIPGCNYFNKM